MMKRIVCLLSIIIISISSCISFEDNKQDDTILKKFSGDNVIPENANTIKLEKFSDRSNSDKAGRLRTKIKEQLTSDGRLAVLDSLNTDLVLRGQITEFFIKGLSFDAAQMPLLKRIKITASIKLIDKKHNKIIFIENDIQAFLNYSESISPVKNDMQAEEEVLEMLAKRISKKVLSGWYTEYMNKMERGTK